MSNNFDTVRKFIESVHLGEWTGPINRGGALTALSAIEADHFTSHDMASAAAQGFRDGVASVQGEPVAHLYRDRDGALRLNQTHPPHEDSFAVYTAPVAQQPQAEAVPPDVVRDAERYRQVRSGQKWWVIDGIGGNLSGEALDAAIDAAMAQGAKTCVT